MLSLFWHKHKSDYQ